MNVQFDPEADALYVTISGAEVTRTEEIRPGIILDYDDTGEVVGVEMLYVSKRARSGPRPAPQTIS